MPMCAGTKRDGARCSILCAEGEKYCRHHRSQGAWRSAAGFGTAAFLSQFIAPGLGPALIGGASYLLGENVFGGTAMVGKKRVFVSFDFDEDRVLKDFIIQQAKNPDSPFNVIDHSLKEAAPERSWKDKARSAIKRSDIVLVMVGPKTHRAPGVLAEVAMAREEGIPIVQVIGYKNGDYVAVPNAGRLYRWNWENLKNLLG
jgi:hypothetical protein